MFSATRNTHFISNLALNKVIIEQSPAESMHAYLTRENAIIDSNGLSIPWNILVQQYHVMRSNLVFLF